MRHLRQMALILALALALTVGAFAAEVPDSLTVENLNGQQRMVKTYVLPPDIDPEILHEPSFEYDGFAYTWAYTTKDEHTFTETKDVTETVTVETSSKDLSVILEQLAPTLEYDDGTYSGELVLDHTTITTEAAGYATRSSTVTETKTIGPLDRNDMSYVPATTVKDGKTLTLSNVEWQIIGTDLVGEVLAPCSYQAVATYSGSSSYSVATGYVTTAEYRGTVTATGVDSITYTVVYVGTEIVPETPEKPVSTFPIGAVIGIILLVLLLAALAGLGIYLFLHRKSVYIYVPGDKPRDYKLVAKFCAEPDAPEVDISELDPYPIGTVAVEVKRPLAKKLLGQSFTVRHHAGEHIYTIRQDRPGDWHEFDLEPDPEEMEDNL